MLKLKSKLGYFIPTTMMSCLMSEIILITPEGLAKILRKALKQHQADVQAEESSSKLYNINQVAKLLDLAHQTVKKMVIEGKIKSTVDGKISQEHLDEYLGKK